MCVGLYCRGVGLHELPSENIALSASIPELLSAADPK